MTMELWTRPDVVLIAGSWVDGRGTEGESDSSQVEEACAAAAAAAPVLAMLAPWEKAALLEAIADELQQDREAIVESAVTDSNLPVARIDGELTRTQDQLRFLGSVAVDGHHLSATIEREGALRSLRVPIGPVAVFGAANFPLAFSVAGGDTAAALAAGCPVVAMTHPAHDATARRVAAAVERGVRRQGLPGGVFSLLRGHASGQQLVTRAEIAAVGFTGSRRVGELLMTLAVERSAPIPVYAEMSSVNPVIVLPGHDADSLSCLAAGWLDSLTLGTGQFCTNPGILLVPDEVTDHFCDELLALGEGRRLGPMLTDSIEAQWRQSTFAMLDVPDVKHVVGEPTGPISPVVVRASIASARQHEALLEECFGPTGVLLSYADVAEAATFVENLGGQLTITLHVPEQTPSVEVEQMGARFSARAGRVLRNAWPTGVEVVWSMQHGGPYPSSSDSRHTSVGGRSVERFLRPISLQGFTEGQCHPGVRVDNPWNIPQRIDGILQPASKVIR